MRIPWLSVLGVGLIALSGCSQPPTAPAPSPGAYSSPQFLRVLAPANATTGAGSDDALTGEAMIDGATGGSVSVGRFTVAVPAGAFQGTATIAIEVADQSELVCDVQVVTGNVTNFAVPAQLTVDCTTATAAQLSQAGALGLSESENLWYVLPGSNVNQASLQVGANLSKPGTCGVAIIVQGKAGW